MFDDGAEACFDIRQDNGDVYLCGRRGKHLYNVVDDSVAGVGHQLCEGSIFKLGRRAFTVERLVVKEAPDSTRDEAKITATACDLQKVQLQSAVCRICLEQGPGDGDPLISPCQCKGSVEYVHLGCLRHWLRVRSNAAGASQHGLAIGKCDLCKTQLCQEVALGNGSVLLAGDAPQAPYIALKEHHHHGPSQTHYLSLATGSLALGRGKSCDVNLDDTSLSRHHATLRFRNGGVFLEDHGSKFGTLVRIKGRERLEVGRVISVQIGRSVFSIQRSQ